jgi:hypothetical protein
MGDALPEIVPPGPGRGIGPPLAKAVVPVDPTNNRSAHKSVLADRAFMFLSSQIFDVLACGRPEHAAATGLCLSPLGNGYEKTRPERGSCQLFLLSELAFGLTRGMETQGGITASTCSARADESQKVVTKQGLGHLSTLLLFYVPVFRKPN